MFIWLPRPNPHCGPGTSPRSIAGRSQRSPPLGRRSRGVMRDASTMSRQRRLPARRAGRPRFAAQSADKSRSWKEPREEILDAAASLFVDRGVAATSTRDIADAVGIRQSSIYYHFPSGKDEILADLLQRSIRPTLDKIEKLETLGAETGVGPDVLLYLLVVLDVRTLAHAPHNAGVLAGLPEVQRKEVFGPFGAARQDLAEAYARLGAQVRNNRQGATSHAPGGDLLGDLLLQFVEVVIGMRSNGHRLNQSIESIIAASCLQACLADQTRIDEVAASAGDLLEFLEA
ncbi:TetR/AcrR family transcriptional regulator [Nocardioides sp. NPDC058538]|uniref:TetR/AcrR family transcriptional regulator n=1 Tax=Nocardioides sp. NPDC058538 TaxID=3346542 RepID=UPI0036590CCE